MEAATVMPERPSRTRPVLVAVAVGLSVALCIVAIGFSIVAIPLFLLARIEPGSGIDRPVVRDGLTYVALPLGIVLGAVAGAVVGVWYGRGGRLPEGSPDDRFGGGPG